jgi:hypothetical protein
MNLKSETVANKRTFFVAENSIGSKYGVSFAGNS